MGSFFHSQYAISEQLSPIPNTSSGMESIEADDFTIHCLKSPTGLKFLLITEPKAKDIQRALSTVYTLFSDIVCKNPFYVFNQPIKNPLFDSKIAQEFQ